MSWRAKIGIVYPADGALDDEYWAFVPEGVTVHITRFAATDEQTIEVFEEQANSPDIENAASHLSVIGPDSIGYACTSGSFIYGAGKDKEIGARMEAATGVPCTTTSTAIVNALKALGVHKLAVAAPYPDDVTGRLKVFLEEYGFEVVSIKGLGLMHGIAHQPVGASYQLAKETDVPEAEAVVISCTNFRTANTLAALEQDLGKPVVSANQATMWELLCLAGVNPNLEGLGDR
ncbi:MAG: Arylmalonate decarboxylase [Chloroflexi bacterium]|nr:Arylmalonate decarboxylase [Chloroflexota bacterium]